MLPTAPRPPIFVIGTDGEVIAFDDVVSAAKYMEPIDVKNGEYAGAFDSDGNTFDIQIVRRPTKLFWGLRMNIDVVELSFHPGAARPDELRAALQQYLRELAEADASPDATLAELAPVAYAKARERH